MTYEQAQEAVNLMDPRDLWNDIEGMVELYLTNVGINLPHGHTWHEVQLHGNSQDCFFLLTIMADITQNGLGGEWIQMAIQIVSQW